MGGVGLLSLIVLWQFWCYRKKAARARGAEAEQAKAASALEEATTQVSMARQEGEDAAEERFKERLKELFEWPTYPQVRRGSRQI